MSLPDSTSLKTLTYNFRGRPFYYGSKSQELRGLALNFWGRPFAGVNFEQSSHVITAQAASMHISGAIVGLAFIATGIADLTISGQCVSAGVMAGVTMIDAAPGVVSIAGELPSIYGWIGVIAEPAIISIAGNISNISKIYILSPPEPGITGISGSAIVTGPVAILAGSRKLYKCVLSANGVDDVVVPISSFTSRQRAGDPSYSEVIVLGLDALADILERQTGTFIVAVEIVKSGVVLQRVILFETEISAVSISGNTIDQQIMLYGYRTSEAASVPAVVPVSGVTYRSLDRGITTIRKPEPDLYLRPGDTVQYDGDEFTVTLITFSYSAVFGSSMEIFG